MIRSMTGYGSAELERSGQRLTAEIRSVNHRFCEVSLRGPKVALAFEDQIRQLIQEQFSRGKFNLTITWSGIGESVAIKSPVSRFSTTGTSSTGAPSQLVAGAPDAVSTGSQRSITNGL